jgi:hypothetical protein
MILYHGSPEQISHPEIREPNRTLDYGSGFYTTTSYQQAEEWVRRRKKMDSDNVGYVNEYELDIDALKRMKCLMFDAPTEEWLDFVMKNRTDRHFIHNYDVVYGPVANDRVYAAFALYEGGLLTKQNLIAELKTYKLVDQYLFHTTKSLKAIRFIKANQIQL